jgi:hypothetical protein
LIRAALQSAAYGHSSATPKHGWRTRLTPTNMFGTLAQDGASFISNNDWTLRP